MLLLHTLKQKIPFVGLSEQCVRAGALMALATSLAENGRQAAQRVDRILAGEPAGTPRFRAPNHREPSALTLALRDRAA